jgi:hypothetical protein
MASLLGWRALFYILAAWGGATLLLVKFCIPESNATKLKADKNKVGRFRQSNSCVLSLLLPASTTATIATAATTAAATATATAATAITTAAGLLLVLLLLPLILQFCANIHAHLS